MVIMARWQSLQIPGHKTRHNNPHPAPHCHCFTTLTNTVRPRGCRGRVSKSRIWGWIWDVYQADLVTPPSPGLTGAVVTRTSAKCCWVLPDWAKVVKVVVLSQTLWLSVDWVVAVLVCSVVSTCWRRPDWSGLRTDQGLPGVPSTQHPAPTGLTPLVPTIALTTPSHSCLHLHHPCPATAAIFPLR